MSRQQAYADAQAQAERFPDLEYLVEPVDVLSFDPNTMLGKRHNPIKPSHPLASAASPRPPPRPSSAPEARTLRVPHNPISRAT